MEKYPFAFTIAPDSFVNGPLNVHTITPSNHHIHVPPMKNDSIPPILSFNAYRKKHAVIDTAPKVIANTWLPSHSDSAHMNEAAMVSTREAKKRIPNSGDLS